MTISILERAADMVGRGPRSGWMESVVENNFSLELCDAAGMDPIHWRENRARVEAFQRTRELHATLPVLHAAVEETAAAALAAVPQFDATIGQLIEAALAINPKLPEVKTFAHLGEVCQLLALHSDHLQAKHRTAQRVVADTELAVRQTLHRLAKPAAVRDASCERLSRQIETLRATIGENCRLLVSDLPAQISRQRSLIASIARGDARHQANTIGGPVTFESRAAESRSAYQVAKQRLAELLGLQSRSENAAAQNATDQRELRRLESELVEARRAALDRLAASDVKDVLRWSGIDD